ncbi:SAM-dependent methyltransferase [Actinoplanes derwentensis]|uniref:S-adenosyl methyltransferase n=1 Tax=Actinoplanes derwentensis TaxID=113562 RepID=A0A1H2CVK4_9ACTN|nr:SAM-dependent methyltransferase [Actinoplanes derwentensis]SDT74491.1 S-adenosyl methyltransferase [Actinoplanes derwentensis]
MTGADAELLRTDVPHAARVYDYILGGKDNFTADRAAAKQMVTAGGPLLPISMGANRRFMARVARFLAAEQGIRQFLDIGTGLPTHPNLHEVVQAVRPDADIVYVDNDPLVMVHARALLAPAHQATGRLAYLEADLRTPDAILGSDRLRDTLDLTQPVAVTMIAVLQLVDDDTARRVIDHIMATMVPGSALAISAVVSDWAPDDVRRIVDAAHASGLEIHARTKAQVEALFAGLELVEPGVVPVHYWHPDSAEVLQADQPVGMFGGIAVKP